MCEQKITGELKKYRKTMPRQTLKTIRGQAIAGDVEGASKGLNREIKKLDGMRVEDCFAYTNRGCKALKVKNCKGCNFYKTKEEVEAGRIKAMERIMALDKETREFIIETYKLEV
jgi:hypothetical protein